MTVAADSLPDDPGTLKAMLIVERAQNDRLRQIIKELQRDRFERRSETLPEDQMLLGLEEVEQVAASGEAETEAANPAERAARSVRRRMNRGSLPAHLPRIETVVDIEEHSCPCCGKPLHRIGEDTGERLDIVPAQFRVLVVRRPKYACRACENVVVQAPAPARLTDGTAAGTHELTDISGANAAGVNPFDPTVFKGGLIFNGINMTGQNGLWVTDGSTAGTHEMTDISGANAAGVNPFYLTAFKGEVLFHGQNSAGNYGLWLTDGTAAGTHEVDISGAFAGGINPTDLTVFKDEVLFKGSDAAGNRSLWVTDGTTAATHEITGIDANGLASIDPDLHAARASNWDLLF